MKKSSRLNKLVSTCVNATVISLAALTPIAGYAATYEFTVNSLLDSNDETRGDGVCADRDGLCTLRAAVDEGNALTALSNENKSHITLVQRNYTLTSAADVALKITGTIEISARDAYYNATITKDPNIRSRVIEVVENGNLHLDRISVTNGLLEGDDTRGSCGAGIYVGNNARLSGEKLNVYNNKAERASGGGICNRGILKLVQSNISSNTSTDFSPGNPQVLGGGGLLNSGYADIHTTSIRENTAHVGGAVFTSTTGVKLFDGKKGQLIMSSSSIYGNVAEIGGAAIHSNYGDLKVLNSSIVRNDVESGGTLGAISLKNMSEYSESGSTQASSELGRDIFLGQCIGCHASTPIVSANYSFESLSDKILSTMRFFAGSNCSPIVCAESAAKYLIENGGEGDVEAPFYDEPKALIWGSVIAQNSVYQTDITLYPPAVNCSTPSSTFSEDSGYNVWGANFCSGASNATDVTISFVQEDRSNLNFNFIELTRRAMRGFENLWPNVANQWFNFGYRTGVKAVVVPSQYAHIFPSVVPGLCPDYAQGCDSDLSLDGTLLIRDAIGPYTPGAFQNR